jgi:5,10-methylene-tetrahydrofolate dehydrogenase/methenyl tetrahydrofolate cyclohydrolase
MAEIIDGNAIADEIKQEILAEKDKLGAKGITPGIATLLVGEDFGSRMYRGQVEKNCPRRRPRNRSSMWSRSSTMTPRSAVSCP